MRLLKAKDVKYIVVHCTDTPAGRDVTAEEVDVWHRQRGYEMIGYHYLVRLDGRIEHGRPTFYQGAHCRIGGVNAKSIGVCYVGGRDLKGDYADTRTGDQKHSLTALLYLLTKRFPGAQVVGHRDFDKGKMCPCFDVKSAYRNLEFEAIRGSFVDIARYGL